MIQQIYERKITVKFELIEEFLSFPSLKSMSTIFLMERFTSLIPHQK